jgi:hypothetical protein
MPSSRMIRCVALVRTEVSEERIGSITRVKRISELRTTLAITTNRTTLREILCEEGCIRIGYKFKSGGRGWGLGRLCRGVVGNTKWPNYKGRFLSLGGGGFTVNRATVKDSVGNASQMNLGHVRKFLASRYPINFRPSPTMKPKALCDTAIQSFF